jgi:hypothetical protein
MSNHDVASPLSGPLEATTFPEQLTARITTPGERPRVAGYDVEADLARHYAPADLLFLSLTGELPDSRASRVFGVVLVFLAPVSIAHASTHGASLARLCGAATSSVIGVGCIGLAEQARVLVQDHRELLAWLDTKDGDVPTTFLAQDDAERASVARLIDALSAAGFDGSALATVTRDAALLMLLFELGFRRATQLEATIVCARLPTTIAEAFSTKTTSFNHYPMNLPRYEYEES